MKRYTQSSHLSRTQFPNYCVFCSCTSFPRISKSVFWRICNLYSCSCQPSRLYVAAVTSKRSAAHASGKAGQRCSFSAFPLFLCHRLVGFDLADTAASVNDGVVICCFLCQVSSPRQIQFVSVSAIRQARRPVLVQQIRLLYISN